MMLIAGARVVTYITATISADSPNEVAVRARPVKSYVTGAPRTWVKRASRVSALANAPASFVPRRVILYKARICHKIIGTQTPLLECGASNATSQAETVSRPTFGMRVGSAMYHSPIGILASGFELAADEAQKDMDLAGHGTDNADMVFIGLNANYMDMGCDGHNNNYADIVCVDYNADNTEMDCVGHNADNTEMDCVGNNADDTDMACVNSNADDTEMVCVDYNYNYSAMDCVGHKYNYSAMDCVGHNADNTDMDCVGHNADDTAMDRVDYNNNYVAMECVGH
ncbi:hypothetical protein IW136_003560 [Coemansia sp. RSA 678]|nr:hypothetical protein IW136_003560 [Coemansia sp. RSA 678]